jgi:hypothetical protein
MLIIEEVSAQVCRQTLEGDINIRIPGLGSIAERIIRQSLKDVYSNIPQVVERCACGPTSYPTTRPRSWCEPSL